ncbi:gastrin/cholecystokinin-like peptide [Pelobates fuscus]|uniref:gastrin/cholecystokinin-like peptide n=1 Tax=Pelobates fuscus TaxID=191477 RepID=UPI002FE4CFE1
MDRKVCVGVLLAILVTASLCKPLKRLESARHSDLPKTSSSGLSRRDLMESLSHEQRQIMSQLFPQLSELLTAEGHFQPKQDRDYAGWMDFGRRSSEDIVSDS